jgi:hypothetical protein
MSTQIQNDNVNENKTLMFPNELFHGKEGSLRITDDSKWVSVFDIIKMVGEQKNYRTIWDRIEKNTDQEVVNPFIQIEIIKVIILMKK